MVGLLRKNGSTRADEGFEIEDYVLFDCPGQVELFTHHSSLRNIFMRIQKLGYRVCSHIVFQLRSIMS